MNCPSELPEEEAGPGPDPEVSSEAAAEDSETAAAGPSNDLNNNADKLAPAGKWTGSQDIGYAEEPLTMELTRWDEGYNHLAHNL